MNAIRLLRISQHLNVLIKISILGLNDRKFEYCHLLLGSNSLDRLVSMTSRLLTPQLRTLIVTRD